MFHDWCRSMNCSLNRIDPTLAVARLWRRSGMNTVQAGAIPEYMSLCLNRWNVIRQGYAECAQHFAAEIVAALMGAWTDLTDRVTAQEEIVQQKLTIRQESARTRVIRCEMMQITRVRAQRQGQSSRERDRNEPIAAQRGLDVIRVASQYSQAGELGIEICQPTGGHDLATCRIRRTQARTRPAILECTLQTFAVLHPMEWLSETFDVVTRLLIRLCIRFR